MPILQILWDAFVATYGGFGYTEITFWLRFAALTILPIGWFLRQVWRITTEPKPFGWRTYMRGLVANITLRDALTRHWKVLAYIALALTVFFGNVMSEAYRAGVASTKPDIERVEAKAKSLSALTSVEPQDSLRRRALRLADAIDTFQADRRATHPPYTNGVQDAPPEQKLINDASVKYDMATESLCLRKFKEEIVGIPRELRDKGLDVQWLDQIQQVRCLNDQDTQILRNLAYRLDEHGNIVRF